MINRPHPSLYWAENDEPEFALSWGSGCCDPVWHLAVAVKLPARLARLTDRWYARRARPKTGWRLWTRR